MPVGLLFLTVNFFAHGSTLNSKYTDLWVEMLAAITYVSPTNIKVKACRDDDRTENKSADSFRRTNADRTMGNKTAVVISKTTVKRAFSLLGILGFILLGTYGLHMRAASGQVTDVRLLPVATQIINQTDSYRVREFYTGRVEARQTVNLGFESAGKLDAVYVDEGDLVKQGAVIARLDTKLLEAARDQTAASVDRISAQTELAKLTTKRQKDLFEQGHSSEQRYDEARLNLQTLQAQLLETQAALRTININIEKSTLTAPFDAQVGLRSADVGSVRDAGMSIVTLLETSGKQARISLPTSRIAALQQLDELEVSFQGRKLAARVLSIRADVNQTTRTQDVLLDIASAETIPFGELVELSLLENRYHVGYWVPVEALVEGKKGLWNVFAVQSDETGNMVVRRAVEVIHAETSRVYVTADLGNTATLVSSGTHRVVPGQYISPANEVD